MFGSDSEIREKANWLNNGSSRQWYSDLTIGGVSALVAFLVYAHYCNYLFAMFVRSARFFSILKLLLNAWRQSRRWGGAQWGVVSWQGIVSPFTAIYEYKYQPLYTRQLLIGKYACAWSWTLNTGTNLGTVSSGPNGGVPTHPISYISIAHASHVISHFNKVWLICGWKLNDVGSWCVDMCRYV